MGPLSSSFFTDTSRTLFDQGLDLNFQGIEWQVKNSGRNVDQPGFCLCLSVKQNKSLRLFSQHDAVYYCPLDLFVERTEVKRKRE